MFGRSFLIALSLLSLGWIGYVSYDLLNTSKRLDPENIFSPTDGKILIINRNHEVQLTELDYAFHEQTKILADQLLSVVYPGEQIYFSEKRPLVLVKTPNLWSDELVLKFLKLKGLSHVKKEDGTYQVNTNFEIRYKVNNLLIYKKDTPIKPIKAQDWPVWDKLASASIIYLKRPLKSTNVYFRKNGTIAYETNLAEEFTSVKVDDADLFSQELPASLSDYRFYEKEYAVKTSLLSEESPLNEWVEDGFVLFHYDDELCLLSDYNKMADPLSILNTEAKIDQEANFFTLDLMLNEAGSFENGFYADKVGDKILISGKKAVVDKIIADYQVGNTLALNELNYKQIYDKLPKKVSERIVEAENRYALSNYHTLEIRTVLASGKDRAISLKNGRNIKAQQEEYTSFGIQGELISLLAGQDLVYGFSSEEKLVAFDNKKQVWEFEFEGNLLGEPQELDLLGNGKRQVLFNTKEAVYLLNRQGKTVNEFPFACPASNPVSFYKWNGKTNFLVVNVNNELLQLDENGRVLKKLKLNCGEVRNEVDVYRSQGKLIANVRGENEFLTVDLERNRIFKRYPKINPASLALKTDAGFNYYSIDTKGLVQSNPDSPDKVVFGGAELKKLKRYKFQKLQFLACTDNRFIYLVDQQAQIKKIAINQKEVEDFDLLFEEHLVKNIALLDGVENKIRVLNADGKPIHQRQFDGKDKLVLSMVRQQLCLTTFLQNNVMQYFILTGK